MPAKIYYDQDADLGLLKGKKIAIIGYGSQGHAHALNLKDSGQDVVVGLYKGGKSWTRAEKDGHKVAPVADAAKMGDVVMILLPDQTQREVFEQSVRANMSKGKMLMFAHGFNIHFNQVVPPPDVDVTMIAPKAPGHVMRDLFVQGPGVPALVAVQQDVTGKARDMASSRPPSKRKRRPTSLESKQPCVVASPTSSKPHSKPSWRPATSPRSPTSSACTR